MFIIIDNNGEEIDKVENEWDAKEICNNHNYGLPECECIDYYDEDEYEN